MITTTHFVAPEEIMAYLDGELSAAEAQAVSLHLDECANCAALADDLQSTAESLSRWTVPAIPQELENRIHNLATNKTMKPSRDISRTWRPWLFGGGGAVIAVTLFLIFATSRSENHGYAYIDPQLAPTPPHAEKSAPVSQATMIAELAPPPPPPSASRAIGGGGGQAKFSPKTIAALDTTPMIARTISLLIQVKNVETARVSLDQILARHHGYSAQLNASTAEGAARSLSASLRIPALELASTLAEIKTLGRIENESQSGEEVTQQHEDLAARLITSRGTEERLRAILQQRTGKVSDVLEVEEEIARVRGEIESMEAEQKTLEHRVDFATVDIQLTEDYKAPLSSPDNSAGTRIHNSFVAGYRNATDTLLGFLLFFEEYGPTILIWLAVLVVPVLLAWRRYRRLHSNL